MAGRFPLFTDENVDGDIIQGLRNRGWDVQHAYDEFGEKTKDTPIFEYAATQGRVFVSTDHDLLPLANKWVEEGRRFRLIWWEQMETQRILVSVVLDAFDALAAKPNAFAYPIEFLKLPK